MKKDNNVYTSWSGKSEAYDSAYSECNKVFVPDPLRSVSPNTTRNMYIEGDNIDALRILKQNHTDKIKMIYIDPPYNTHKRTFVYTDDRERAEWMGMMYSRLLLSHDLLSDDGIILISIDDTEFHYLRMLCDEVFGEYNLVCNFVWVKKKGAQGMVRHSMVVSNHEYILAYAKDVSKFRFRGECRVAADGFGNPDSDPRGPWKKQYLQRMGLGHPVRTLVDPNTGTTYTFESPYSQETLDEWLIDGRIVFPSCSGYPYRKEYLSEYQYPRQLESVVYGYPSRRGTQELKKVFGGHCVFNNAKPVDLMSYLVYQCTNDTDTVLDFFSGSGSTACGVLDVNNIYNGSRRFIMVQLPEPYTDTHGTGFRTLCDLGSERIRRHGHQITNNSVDTGFIYYSIADA